MTAKELFYFNLYTSDLDKSKVFYKEVLGWEIGGGSLGGHVSNTDTPCGVGPGSSETAVYFVADDLDTALALVQKHGGKIISQELFEGIGRAAFCQDDQGTHFALQEPGTEEMKQHAKDVKKGSKHGDLFFFSLPVQSEVKAKAFFGAVLGWEFGSRGEQGGLAVTNFKGPDGGLGCGRPGHCPSFWFRVDDIHKASDLVKKFGGKADEIFEAPEGIMCECADDQGVKIGLAQPAAGY